MMRTQNDQCISNSLTLLAVDKESFYFITRLKGHCLFFNKPFNRYWDIPKLSCCYQQEVWVLYALRQNYTQALELARLGQLAGSLKTFTIFISTK